MFATSDHDRPWPSPSVASACAGSSACSDPLRGPRRTRTSRSWCSATRCASSSANPMRASPTALRIGRSSPPSPGCRDGAGAASSSCQRRSFVGTESSRGANGDAGDPLVALVGRPCPLRLSSSSSISPERTCAGVVPASRASFEGWGTSIPIALVGAPDAGRLREDRPGSSLKVARDEQRWRYRRPVVQLRRPMPGDRKLSDQRRRQSEVTADSERPVEALFTYGPYPALRDRVRPRRSHRCLDHLYAFGGEHVVEAGGELGVAVCAHQLGHHGRRRISR